jgi:cytochrome c551
VTVRAPIVVALLLLFAAGCGSSGSSASNSVPSTGTPGGSAGPAAPASAAPTRNVAAANLFSNNCSGCHGAAGQGGVGPNLQTLAAAGNAPTVRHQVMNGGGGMPPFKDKLSDQQIAMVVNYVVKEIHGQ